ncbi:AAA family ATPase [Bradyrhizobium barranii]|uniref:AAA family ATPase n=1 Tax=Bradyrhizobium barranii TaxID=2992140 RepID=UPI0024AF69FF|nr:AAA family ATPase [Bradyrhizobium barranii]WFT95060.1 AAA family ATPase [Bradyrhizobium barranii]
MTPRAQVKEVSDAVTQSQNSGLKRVPTVDYEFLGDPSIVQRKEWVVPGLCGIGEVVVIHAETKIGKTQFATYLSLCVATGTDFFRRKVRQGAVLYLALEKGRITKKRFRASQKLHGNIRPPIAVSTTPINLTTAKDASAVIATMREISSKAGSGSLIVIDTLNRCAGGVDENAAGPMGTMMNELTRIAEEAQVAVVVLHHNTEGRGKARGSTTITASADVVISIQKEADEVRAAEVTLANDAPDGQTFRFRMPVIEVTPETEDADAEFSVSIEPIYDEGDRDAGGAPKGAQATASKADLQRAERVFALFDTIAADGRIERATLLDAARQQEIVTPLNPSSSSEMLRRCLVELKKQSRLDFTSKEVWTQPEPAPTPTAQSSLKREDLLGDSHWAQR